MTMMRETMIMVRAGAYYTQRLPVRRARALYRVRRGNGDSPLVRSHARRRTRDPATIDAIAVRPRTRCAPAFPHHAGSPGRSSLAVGGRAAAHTRTRAYAALAADRAPHRARRSHRRGVARRAQPRSPTASGRRATPGAARGDRQGHAGDSEGRAGQPARCAGEDRPAREPAGRVADATGSARGTVSRARALA